MTSTRRLNRLSPFLSAFPLRVYPAATTADATGPRTFSYWRAIAPQSRSAVKPRLRLRCPGTVLMAAVVEFGGDSNPLLHSLPEELTLDPREGEQAWALAAHLLSEVQEPRCGGPAALARLGELLVLMILRKAIDRDATQPRLLRLCDCATVRLCVCPGVRNRSSAVAP